MTGEDDRGRVVQRAGTQRPDGSRPVWDLPPPAGDRVPLPPPEPPPADLVLDACAAQLEAARDARSRLARLAELEGVPLAAASLLSLLEALPDGWQRRTALRRLIEAGSLHDVDADAIVRTFGRGADRFAVAARLVDAGLAEVEVVTGALPVRAAARLRRRAGAT